MLNEVVNCPSLPDRKRKFSGAKEGGVMFLGEGAKTVSPNSCTKVSLLTIFGILCVRLCSYGQCLTLFYSIHFYIKKGENKIYFTIIFQFFCDSCLYLMIKTSLSLNSVLFAGYPAIETG